MLFWHKHNIEKSLADLPNFTPFPDEWTIEDKVLFEQAFSFHGKSFHRIQQMVNPQHKSVCFQLCFTLPEVLCTVCPFVRPNICKPLYNPVYLRSMAKINSPREFLLNRYSYNKIWSRIIFQLVTTSLTPTDAMTKNQFIAIRQRKHLKLQ